MPICEFQSNSYDFLQLILYNLRMRAEKSISSKKNIDSSFFLFGFWCRYILRKRLDYQLSCLDSIPSSLKMISRNVIWTIYNLLVKISFPNAVSELLFLFEQKLYICLYDKKMNAWIVAFPSDECFSFIYVPQWLTLQKDDSSTSNANQLSRRNFNVIITIIKMDMVAARNKSSPELTNIENYKKKNIKFLMVFFFPFFLCSILLRHYLHAELENCVKIHHNQSNVYVSSE